jgi:hypothetical protein
MMTTAVLLSWLPWIVAAIASPLWYLLVFGPVGFGRVLSWMSSYWFPIGLIGLVYAMAGGQFGASLGIPALFRDDPAAGFNANSRAVWGAFAATWLIGQVWLMIYVHLCISRPALLDDTTRPEARDGPASIGAVSNEVGRGCIARMGTVRSTPLRIATS